jgi:hypothetical protein
MIMMTKQPIKKEAGYCTAPSHSSSTLSPSAFQALPKIFQTSPQVDSNPADRTPDDPCCSSGSALVGWLRVRTLKAQLKWFVLLWRRTHFGCAFFVFPNQPKPWCGSSLKTQQ